MLTFQLLDWGLRATLLLVGALLIARAVERRSAVIAHRSLVAMLACVLLLPLLMTFAPGWEWTIPLAKDSDAGTSKSGPDQTAGEYAAPTGIERTSDQPVETNASPAGSPRLQDLADKTLVPLADPGTRGSTVDHAHTVESSPAANGEDSPNPSTRRRGPVNWGRHLAVVWLAIGGMLLLRVLIFVMRLRRFVASCPEASTALSERIRELSLDCGLKRFAQVRLSNGNKMPMACWLGRWIIVVPEDLRSWPKQLQEATLLHELGHIARRDAWADFLAQCVACILWPSPMTWIAAWEVRRLRERACDEWSLQKSGIDAKQYARILIEVVRRCQPPHAGMASAMADKRGFESRVRWLLSRARPQIAWPLASGLVLLGVLGLAVTVATARPAHPGRQGGSLRTVGADTTLSPVILSKEPSPNHPAITVKGVVRDPAHTPLAGVPVVLRANLGGVQYASIGFPHTRDVLARTTTNSRGEFEFNRIGIPPRMVDVIDDLRQGKVGAQLLAWGQGYALQWQPILSFQESDKEIRLAPEVEVSGVVVDEQGSPLDQVKLTVVGFSKATEYLDAFLKDPGDLGLVRSEVDFHTTTRQGRFALPNMPRDYRISIRCEGTKGHRSFFIVDTGDGAEREAKYRNAGRQSVTIYRSPVRVTAKQQHWIRLQVVDHQGNPVTGGGVQAIDANRHFGGGSAEVDDNGIAILTVNEPGIHEVHYSGDPLSPVLGLVQAVDIQPNRGATVEMKLFAQRTLSGTVVDSDTGEPVPGVYVHGGRTNEGQDMPRAAGAVTVSGSDGRFQLPVTDGVYRFSIRHEVDGYYVPTLAARREAGPEPDFPTVTVTPEKVPGDVVLRIARGLVVEGTVLDQRSMPASGVMVQAMNEGPPYRQLTAMADSHGRFRFVGLSPYVPTELTAWSDSGVAQQTISAVIEQPWGETLWRTVELKIAVGTTVVGQVVKDGKPVSGVHVRLRRAGPAQPGEEGVRFDLIGETVTDQQGRYRLTGLRKGDRYHLEVEPQGDAEVRDWHYQMPFSHTVEAENGTKIELPAAKLTSNGQTLAGIVVDPEGNPVEGITVSARLASGGHLSRPRNGPPPWTKTDGQGRFRLTHLPDQAISLMAYKANPAGGRILYPSHASPDLGAQDIRIIFDPSLQEGIEDLDRAE